MYNNAVSRLCKYYCIHTCTALFLEICISVKLMHYYSETCKNNHLWAGLTNLKRGGYSTEVDSNVSAIWVQGHLAVSERWLPNTVTILDRVHCICYIIMLTIHLTSKLSRGFSFSVLSLFVLDMS